MPEFLFEFDNYEETDLLQFYGNLSEEDYLIIKNLFAGIINGSPDDDLNQILKLPIDFNNACECTNYCYANEPTLLILHKMEQFLSAHKINYPDINKVIGMSVEQKNGWGNFVESEYLSIITNE